MLPVLTTFDHMVMSRAILRAKPAGVEWVGSREYPRNRFCTSGCLRMCATSSFSDAMIALGVPAGAASPYQKVAV